LSKLTIRILPVLVVLLLANAKFANAQGVSAYFGVGSAFDSAPKDTTGTCPSGQIPDTFTAECDRAPTMGGAFGVFGADFMIKPHFGINGEYMFRFAQDNYLSSAQLNVRPAFYDFNAVYQPTSGNARVVPVLEAGLGGARLSFYESQTGCITVGTCTTQSQEILSSNHFQFHAGAGVKLYVKSDIFIKPQFDFHWVHNLTDQYGRTTVPAFTISIGYTFGRT
jgi:hypothetical protein